MSVHFVGAGPGAADLLTVRAVRLLSEADLVLYPGTYLDAAVLGHARAEARRIDTQGLDLDQITAHLVAAADAGETVVRLTSGDPGVYSALHEQTSRLDAAGISWDVTPGVPAYAAAAARVGHELTVPRVAQSVVLTRVQARSTPMGSGEDLAAYAASGATIVLHLAVTRIGEVMAELAPVVGADCPALVVYRVSQPAEEVLRGSVGDIAEATERAGFRQAALIMVGRALAPAAVRGGGESYLYSAQRSRAAKRLSD